MYFALEGVAYNVCRRGEEPDIIKLLIFRDSELMEITTEITDIDISSLIWRD